MSEATAVAPHHIAATPAEVLVATKLYIPAPRAELVSRARLVASLSGNVHRKLTLLGASPGSGKTTLLSEWHMLEAAQTPFAWVSLDESDNDPVRFWGCVIEALRSCAPSVGATARDALRVGAGINEVVLPVLINELAALPHRIVLVLDDYHLIGEFAVHESVAFLLDHLPPSLHLAIATRSDPPLAVGRLRTRGEVTEIRDADLRFTRKEAAALLNDALGLDLADAQVATLVDRTEGWAAGLYLAALSLQGRSDADQFIDLFAGDDRHVADYLLSEALDGQPRDLREFLVHSSVLGRLCGPLCDAVTGASDSTTLLERLERSNMFVVPLDNVRVWYRYHRLFRDLLRYALAREAPQLAPELHRRASAWHRENGSIGEAIEHAAAAADIATAADLIAEHWNETFNQGRLRTVDSWLANLPAAVTTGDPRLCVAAAWLAMDRGRLEETARWMERARTAAGGRRGAARRPLDHDLAVLSAVRNFKVGDVAAAQDSAREVLELRPDPFSRTVACCIRGIADYCRERPDDAAAALDEAAALAGENGNDLALVYVLGYRALVQLDRGDLAEAERLAARATDTSGESGAAEHFVTTIGHLALGLSQEHRGALEEADASLARAVELSRRGAGAVERALALAALARVRHSLGRAEEGTRLANEAAEAVSGSPDPGRAREAVEVAERALRRASRPAPGPGDELSERELAVLRLLPSNLSLREIGASLYVSLNTVKTHVKNIYRKLDAAGRDDAVARARELRLL